jgi:hypothetical protein
MGKRKWQKMMRWTKFGETKKGGPRILGLVGIHKVMKDALEKRRYDQQ